LICKDAFVAFTKGYGRHGAIKEKALSQKNTEDNAIKTLHELGKSPSLWVGN
jgi:hypothetical protein